jgi:putative lipoprotein
MKALQPKPFLHCHRIVGGAASLVLSFGLVACALTGQHTASPAPGLSGKVTGTVAYRERIALPPDAVVEVVLLDLSRMDVAATILAQQVIVPKQQVPIPFTLGYDPTAIDTRMSYAVRATIKRGDKLLFVTDRNHPVLTRGYSESVDLVLVRSGGGEALEFGNLASTMRTCPFMALEDRFYRVLEQVERYAIRGTWLMLYGPGGEVATLEAWYE